MIIYTDGACSGNPGRGTWGFLVIKDESSTALIKASTVDDTTNNRMELTAIIEAIKYASKRTTEVTIYSDSLTYCINCFNGWRKKWFKLEKGDYLKVANKDLWDKLFILSKEIEIKLIYVKGHSGDKYNSIIDKVVQGMNKEV